MRELGQDVVGYLETALGLAREDAAAAYDRTDALAELLSVATRAAAELDVRQLTPEALFAVPRDAAARAQLDALTSRAFPDPPDHTTGGTT